jgi:hypothetical protein
MTRRGQSQRLGLGVLVGMKTSVDLPISDDDRCEDETEQHGAHGDHARETDRLDHDVAEARDFVGFDDSHYDWRTWRLHQSIVQQGRQSTVERVGRVERVG